MATQVSNPDLAAGVTLLQSNSSQNILPRGDHSGSNDEPQVSQNLAGASFEIPEQKEPNINYVNLEINEVYQQKKLNLPTQKLKIKTKNQMVQNSSLKTLIEEALSPDILAPPPPREIQNKSIKKVQISNKISPTLSKMNIVETSNYNS